MKTLLFAVFCFTSVVCAQETTVTEHPFSENTENIDRVIRTLYEVISGDVAQPRNWELFKYLFHPNAKLIAAGKDKQGNPQVVYMSPTDYINNSGTWLVDNGFKEVEINRITNNFGNMCHVFSTFETYIAKSDKPKFRGINSIQLYNDGKRWWIINVYWANETPFLSIPKVYLPK